MNIRRVHGNGYTENQNETLLHKIIINCTCGYCEHQLLDFNNLCIEEIDEIKKISPECPNCGTAITIHLYERYCSEIIEKNESVIEAVFYHLDKTAKEMLRIKCDLSNHQLSVKDGNGTVYIKSKQEAESVFDRLYVGSFNGSCDFSAQMAKVFSSPEDRGFIQDKFWYSKDCGEFLYHYVQNRAVQILIHSGYVQWDNVLFIKSISKSKETEVDKILGLPKEILPYVKSFPINRLIYKKLKAVTEKFTIEDLKAGFEIIKGENFTMSYDFIRNFLSLLAEENMPSFKKFVRYLFIEAKHRQGITDPEEVLTLLNDAISTAKLIGETYSCMPPSVKVMRDVLKMRIDQKKD